MPLSLKTMEVQIEGDKWNKRFRMVQLYWESGGKKERFRINFPKGVFNTRNGEMTFLNSKKDSLFFLVSSCYFFAFYEQA